VSERGKTPVLSIVGATATGKSRLAMALAERLGGELVNADALQVYRGLDIGTAKPGWGERRRVPHHLLDILDPAESFSAGEFARLARQVIGDVQSRSRLAIVVGGSGFYQRALFGGLAPIPAVPAAVRRTWRERLAADGLGPLAEELARVDPETAKRLAAGDTQRILRALEVAAATGRPLSEWQARAVEESPLEVIRLGLTLPRPILYDRIGTRVDEMLAAGWVAEVEDLFASAGCADLPAFQAIGYRQLIGYVQNRWGLSEAIEETVRATRRYAKRQETWFRKEADIAWFPATELEQQLPDILKFLMSVDFRGGA
jgi:tRNA dimethylallyltransferase